MFEIEKSFDRAPFHDISIPFIEALSRLRDIPDARYRASSQHFMMAFMMARHDGALNFDRHSSSRLHELYAFQQGTIAAPASAFLLCSGLMFGSITRVATSCGKRACLLLISLLLLLARCHYRHIHDSLHGAAAGRLGVTVSRLTGLASEASPTSHSNASAR